MRAVLAARSTSARIDVVAAERALLDAVAFPRPEEVALDTWTSDDGRTALVVAHNETTVSSPLIVRTGDVVWSHVGQLGTTPTLRVGEELASQIAGVAGRWSAVAIDPGRDVLAAASSPSGSEPLFVGERDGTSFVSSWAGAVARLVGTFDTVDPVALVSMINNGFMATRHTPYPDVTSLAPGSAVVVDSAGTRSHDHLASVIAAQRSATPAMLDDLHDAFVASFGPLGAAGRPVHLSLSGGKDSRLVLAGLLSAGIDVHATTYSMGAVNARDVDIARRLASMTGIRHEVTTPVTAGGVPADRRIDLYSDTVHTLVRTDGMLHGFKTFGRPGAFRPAPVALGGGGGEVLRGGYGHGFLSPSLQPPAALVQRELHKRFGRFASVLRAEAVRRYDAALDTELAEWYGGLTGAQVLDRAYLDYRSTCWLAMSLRAHSLSAVAVHPACDNALVTAALRISAAERSSERTVYELMRRLAPEIAEVPFADDEWGFRRSARTTAVRLWRKRITRRRTPPARAATRPASTDWRDRFHLPPLRDEIVSTITSACNDSALDDVLDRHAFDALVGSPAWVPPRSTQLAFNAYSAALLATREWTSPDPVPRPLDIPAI